ncbi:hypothetical protein OPV22_031357 [Ensete ventricosum]|uniref:Secreted protein n=1 Tax=Ensete ventricosum TaxID=4639 RepID=A0AAV8PKL9_ENSVE|nr:hypothetical protein OPV22_031357 [Ensete ventricosum]
MLLWVPFLSLFAPLRRGKIGEHLWAPDWCICSLGSSLLRPQESPFSHVRVSHPQCIYLGPTRSGSRYGRWWSGYRSKARLHFAFFLTSIFRRQRNVLKRNEDTRKKSFGCVACGGN